MPETYFGGAPNAFQGGVEFASAQRRRRAGDNALRALVERYGPEAADPAALGQLQGIEQRAELHPLAVQQGQQAVELGEEALTDTRNDRLMQAGKNAAFFLERAKQLGMDPGAAFDKVAQILPPLGVPAEQLSTIREQVTSDPNGIDALVAMFRGGQGAVRATGAPVPVYDQQGELRLLQHFSDGSSRIIEDVTPATALQAEERLGQGRTRLGQGQERLNLGWENLDWDQVKELLPARQTGVQNFLAEDGRVVADIVPGSPAEQEMTSKLREMDADDRKLLQSYGATSDHAGVVQRNAERALEYFSGADGGVLLQTLRSGARRIPGTPAFEAWDALEAIKNNIGIDELQRMRQSSPTGGAMGNVSDRDIALLTGALGRLEVERDPERLLEDIQRIQESYSRIIAFAREDAEKAQYRTQLRQRRGSFGPQPRPTPNPPAGSGAAPTASPTTELSDEELLELYLR